MQLSLEDLTYIITHVFLPLNLPHEYDLNSPQKDRVLLNYVLMVSLGFRRALELIESNEVISILPTWDVVIRMLQNVAKLHRRPYLVKTEVEKSLKELEKNDVLPLYITAQNAVVIFRKIQDDRMTFECFEACLPSEEIMKKCNKLQMQFPSNPRLLLLTQPDVLSTLANLLSYLSVDNHDQAIPSSVASHKHGIKTPSPRYITEAIAGIIRATQPFESHPLATTFITKRLNDHVLGGSGKNPWRRSPFWLLVRVSLQTTLLEAKVKDGYGYKAFQVFLMANTLRQAIQDHPLSLKNDEIFFMNAKLARRLAKMGVVTEDPTNTAVRAAGSIVQHASTFLKNRWKEIRENWEGREQWSGLNPQDVQGCLNITFPNSQAYLSRVLDRRRQLAQTTKPFDKRAMDKGLISLYGPRMSYSRGVLPSDVGNKDPIIALFDFECWVDMHLQEWLDSPSRTHEDCLPLANIIRLYRRTASDNYAGQPERLSLMNLCIFELWVALDSLVSKWCTLLLEFSPEVPGDLLDPLILPYSRQMKRLHQVQEYIEQRHQRARRHGNHSVFDDPKTQKSFANRYFALPLASPLWELQIKIEQRAAADGLAKATELENLNRKYEELMKQAATFPCITIRQRVSYGDIRDIHISSSCMKCQIKDEATRLRIHPIEELLPDDTEHSRAIIFELHCPQPFAIWRDIVVEILQAGSLNSHSYHRGFYPLSEYQHLDKFYISAYSTQRVRMASSTRPLASCHDRHIAIPTTLQEVILKHGGQFSLYDGTTHGWINKLSVPEIGKQCTFRLDGVYAPLQDYVEATSHSPNHVIASQHACPTALSIDEYFTFGHIRAGHRLQWRNIIRALRTQTLTFSEASVHFLILQATWQAGPGGTEGLHREAHADLRDMTFCNQALDELEMVLGLIGDNWTQTMFLASAVVLTLRIQSLTDAEPVQHRAGSVLRKARSLAIKWIRLLQESRTSQDKTTIQSRHALVGASLVLRATFDIEASNTVPYFRIEEEVVEYLYAGTFICDIPLNSLPIGLRILVRRDRQLALKLERHVSRMCSTSTILHRVIERRWGNYKAGRDWVPLPQPADRWWSSTTQRGPNSNPRVIHLDIISGSFFIEGKAFDRLPSSYVQHPTYTTLFGSEEIVDVRPSTMKGMSYEGHYHGHEVHLSIIGHDLVVLYCQGQQIEEFIPSSALVHDLPNNLIKGNHHWYKEESSCLEVRPQRQSWERDLPRAWKVVLHTNHGLVTGMASRELAVGPLRLVDVNSQLYKHIVGILRPLEQQTNGILVTIDSDNPESQPTVYLPRHDLTFHVNSLNDLECQSFPGFVLDINYRGIGTLIGLETMISLRCNINTSILRKVIIPKGVISYARGPYNHPTITITPQATGGYFAYDVDNLLGRLHGSRSAESDLFLTQLHAFTSSPLVDDLTGQTGTSVALDYLSGSQSFSMYALTTEARSYLDTLATLTPFRTLSSFQGQMMETIKWDPILPTLSQHPAFLPLIESILELWRYTDVFHSFGNLLNPIRLLHGMDHLSARASSRNWVFHHLAYKTEILQDTLYRPRDCIQDPQSQQREKLSFQVARLSHPFTSCFPYCGSLRDEVRSWTSICGVDSWNWSDIHRWLPYASSMGTIWRTLYELCKATQWPVTFDITAALSLLGYSNVSFEVIATLMAIARQPSLAPPSPPINSPLNLAQGSTFDDQKIRQILLDYVTSYRDSDESTMERLPYETQQAYQNRTKTVYQSRLAKEVKHATKEVKKQWPSVPNRIVITRTRLLKPNNECLQIIHSSLIEWVLNRTFLHHVESIPPALSPLYGPPANLEVYKPGMNSFTRNPTPFKLATMLDLMVSMDPPLASSPICIQPKYPRADLHHDEAIPTDLANLLVCLRSAAQSRLEKRYLKNLAKSILALATVPLSLPTKAILPLTDELESLRDFAHNAHIMELHRLREAFSPPNYVGIILDAANLVPSITPILLLRQLSFLNRQKVPHQWRDHLIRYALTVHDARRASRMIQLCHAQRMTQLSLEIQYRREWEPMEHPDWLLVEIDSDFSIRAEQANMAMEMISPPGGQNSVMQLNMGEGKSSVIVPIVSVSARNKAAILSRVIVPRSQVKQQFHILRQTVTNFCNRRVFYLPFARNLKINQQSILWIKRILEAASETGAIWLCEPEQLLSLKLLGLDRALRDQPEVPTGRYIINMQSWLHAKTCDIIDESDDVLHTKQQVIYTIGEQKSLEAAPWRWELIQRLLGLLVEHLSQLRGDPKSFTVEAPKHATAFPSSIRFKDNGGQIIHDFVIKSIIGNDWSLRSDLIDLSLTLVKEEVFPMTAYRALQQHCPKSSSRALQTLLILRGILQNNLLFHVFKDKRYRVNYGLDLKRSLLAVPYRAKDLPTARSEFGHPDIIILLTCLSYYYGGLDTKMIKQTLAYLPKSGTPDLTYTEWLRPCWAQVTEQLRTLKGVNLQDEKLLEKDLFPLFQHNKLFIDSYLNWVVFPRQAKEFPLKLSSSGWDLATKKQHLTTGFSGTNDGRFLLPTTITQLDRPAQLHTNAKVLAYLLQEENSSVHSYSYSSDSSFLLAEALKLEPPPTVILDVGAQVLDRSNEEFSRLWLGHYKDHPTIKAIIFFKEDELTVMTPDGAAQPLMDSPYAERLDQCLVYLDDAHTRGTDLRLPDTRAVVTLGPRLTKDKLVQGCMRMRKLGQGQNVTFLASDEVIRLIVEATDFPAQDVSSMQVLMWTIKETWKQLQMSLPAYVVQGHSFVRREREWTKFAEGHISPRQLAESLCETESRRLEEMYGPDAQKEYSWIHEYHSSGAQSEISRTIYQRCHGFESFSMTDAGLHEEKEVELIHEREIERVVERPPPVKAAEHALHPDVMRLVKDGQFAPNSNAFMSAVKALKRTSIPIPGGLNNILSNFLVTKDFYHTIQLTSSSSNSAMDSFIRPVEWLVVPSGPDPSWVVVLSPFEVNALFKTIKESQAVRLHLFSPRNSLQMKSFESFDGFILPSQLAPPAFPRHLVHQINIFSGSIFLQDFQTYQDVCKILGLYFDKIESEASSDSLAPPNVVIDETYFVIDPATRVRLGMNDRGFKESPVPFLTKLLITRRHGQGLGPSHMGKLLQGVKLKEDDFVCHRTTS